ncbi:glycosyltransferase family 4 protein [Baekduia sp.]|uniref:glycosyltransferase family 4 protein n=1 Tax=Baekduia sp. TaxID=2600305 RepID=UPI002E012987|nr:glycosyltransferase family 4 protein [Baekduia sp.]
MRLLFFNEGNLGSYVLGQAQVEATLRRYTQDLPEIETRFLGLATQGRWAHAAATWSTPALMRADLDLRLVRWHLVQSLRGRRTLTRAVAQWRPDVVHVHSHSMALGLGALMERVPTAVSVDVTLGDWAAMPAQRRTGRLAEAELVPARRAERRAFRGAALVLAWTDWVRDAVLALEPRATVAVHHPGLDLDVFRPAARRPRTLPRILFVGGRFADKGGDDLLAALGDDLGTTVELDAVTPADVAPRPGLRVHRLGPGDPELMDLRQQADLLVLPSGADAVPWAVLEAMACGVPVVGSTVGAIGDLVGDEAGVLVNFGDRAALREAVLGLLADQPRRAALGAAARARCEARFDAAVQTPALVALLAGLARSAA